MQYRKLGQTDIEVSLICLGTMTFGEQNTEAEAHSQLDYATEQGVNFIDTAELYAIPPKAETQGLTEQFIGNWLKQRQDRDKLVIATKVSGPGDDWVGHIRGGPHLNRKHMTQALDDSLRRLQTDHIDLYQIHWPARKTNFFGQLGFEAHEENSVIPIEETLSVLDDFVASGKIRQIGISNETPWGVHEYLRLAEKRGWPRIATVQNPYNLLNRTYEIGLAEFAPREQVGLMAYSPLGFGVLSGKYLHGNKPPGSRLALFEGYTRYTNPQGIAATEAYVTLAKENGLSPAQMALAWVNSQPFVTTNIIGATSLEQLAENIASIDIELNEDILAGIEAIHTEHPNPCP
ncbi:MAG TPA: NADP(H)-dependent aldo-keto reductase [Chromatiales bacterium]|nr:NADP(H)-dependent aldo-keto reductase [Thiotrichales bacterium]HIP67437.1 NADP(H)-dependent aldo-keto reductase [Chromatiales bacterium]